MDSVLRLIITSSVWRHAGNSFLRNLLARPALLVGSCDHSSVDGRPADSNNHTVARTVGRAARRAFRPREDRCSTGVASSTRLCTQLLEI